MFCKKCGQQIDDGSELCKLCGASQTNAAPASKKKGKRKKVWGIVLLVLGIMCVLGGISNGQLAATFSPDAGLEDFVSFGITIAMVVGGIYLLYRHSSEK